VIPLLAKAAIDGPIAKTARSSSHDLGLLVVIGLAATGIGTMEVLFNIARRWVQARAVAALEQSMRDDVYAHLQRLEPGFHDDWQSGQLLSRGTTDLSAIRRFAGFGVIFMITSVVTFVIIVVLLIRLDPLLGFLIGGLLIPVTALCLRFERRFTVLSRRVQDQQDDLNTYVEEAAAGIRVLKSLGRREEAAGRHRSLTGVVYSTQVAKAQLRGRFWASLDLVPNLAIALILLLGAFAVSQGNLTTGGLVAFVALVVQLIWPIEAMGYILALGQEAATAAQRVYEILDTAPAITDPGPAPAILSAEKFTSELPASPRSAKLTLDHVKFSYPGASAPVLRDVCLELNPGETVALVGATGSGKTTLLNLIVRLADATAGTIRIDHADIREMPLKELRTVVACAFEDPTRRSRRRWQRLRPTSSPTCRGAWTPGSASRGCHCQAASGNGSRWRGQSWPGRRCCCSTTRYPRSTCTPRPRSPRRSGTCSPTRPRSWSRTGRPRWRSPTGSPCSTRARSSRLAATTNCLRRTRITST